MVKIVRLLSAKRLCLLRMSYVTLEIEIDHGKVIAKEAGQLPDKATGLLTILSPAASASGQSSTLKALEAFQDYLRTDEKMATDWLNTVRDARR